MHPACKFDVNCANHMCPYTHTTSSMTRLKLIQPAKPKLLSTIQKIPSSTIQKIPTSTIQKIHPFVKRNA